jgi:glycosyltransferase involved in cell wall biosynthesis
MAHDLGRSVIPLFSIIIPSYNDWQPLNACLRSISEQVENGSFEVIVVDDGSATGAPDSIRNWSRFYPLLIIRESHGGISRARNRGIRAAKGAILLFIDSDSRLKHNCLAALAKVVILSLRDRSFQLHIVGSSTTLVGKSECLRLDAIQNQNLQDDGCIRYLNTAAFAIRRENLQLEGELFDPGVLRGEDTLLLAKLMRKGELPLYVPDAIVEHAISLPLAECLLKEIRSAFREMSAYRKIASMGIQIRMSHRQRLRILIYMWRISKASSLGRGAWLTAVVRQTLRRISTLIAIAITRE